MTTNARKTFRPAVTYDYAMAADVRNMGDTEIDLSRNLLGATKLDIRLSARRDDCFDVFDRLRPINVRIDELNSEETWRQQEVGRARVRKPVNF